MHFPCDEVYIPYAIGWEAYREKSPILWGKYTTNVPGSPHAINRFCCIPALWETDEKTHGIVSSRVGTPPPPFSDANLKKLPPSFWQLSKLVHVNCKKHFKMFRTMLIQLRTSLKLLFLLSGSTLHLLLTISLVRYCL